MRDYYERQNYYRKMNAPRPVPGTCYRAHMVDCDYELSHLFFIFEIVCEMRDSGGRPIFLGVKRVVGGTRTAFKEGGINQCWWFGENGVSVDDTGAGDDGFALTNEVTKTKPVAKVVNVC